MNYSQPAGNGYPNTSSSLSIHGKTSQDYTQNEPGLKQTRDSTDSDVTPYLGKKARLSQIWFNRWTVLLLLILVHFLLTIGSLNDNLADAKIKALSACTKVEDIGSAMASMPHYLSVGVNQLTASSITHAVHALMSILDMILTGVEQLILFVIAMMTDTYVCLITMVIHGGLEAAELVVNKSTELINKGVNDVAGDVEGQAENLQSLVHDLFEAVDKASSVVDTATAAVGDGVSDATSAVGGVGSDITSAIGGIFGREDLSGMDITAPSENDLVMPTPTPTASDAFYIAEEDLSITAFPGPTPTINIALLARDLTEPDIAGPITKAMEPLKTFSLNSTDMVNDLAKLDAEIPTFDEVKNMTGQVISYPFNLIRDELDKVYGNWTFNSSIFPVADKEALSFCSDNDSLNNFFEELFKIAYYAKITAIVVLVILAILACVPMTYLEIRRWRRQEHYARIFSKESFDAMDVGYMWSRPMTSRVGIKFANWIAHKKAHHQVIYRWVIAYATSLPALFVLALALAGYFSCFWQIILLKILQKKIPELTQEVGDFANDVVGTLTGVSQRWANDTNDVILGFSSDINDDILGKVVNATTTVNNTLNTFMDTINDGITTAFGQTLFADLAKEVVRCLLGLKVESVEKGLTWVHDNAHIDFPLLPDNIFSVGANSSIQGDSDLTTFLASPSSVTTDEISGAVLHVTNWLHNNIIQEALISTALLLVYIVVVLIGIVRGMTLLMSVKPEDVPFQSPPHPRPASVRSASMPPSRTMTMGDGAYRERPAQYHTDSDARKSQHVEYGYSNGSGYGEKER
ncbi:hypothetical protein F5Y15DRAFT_177551 [Xylariaceae sp. FL0016]|nr:hypothetical protein F5Y15DRAFT_177551 [Xylariaceae sp. FL0016]